MVNPVSYEQDVVAWANEQARLLRAGRFDLLDIEHIADEIEDVGKSEKREFANRMALLLAHLLKWKHQPERRGSSWEKTIKAQRVALADCMDDTPSLKASLDDARWWRRAWIDGQGQFERETGLQVDLPEECPWTTAEVLSQGWKPE